MKLTEFSLILKPSSLGGIGVFAVHDIPKGTEIVSDTFQTRIMKIVDVPEIFRKYGVYINDEECEMPEHCDRLETIWFLNHSDTPNIKRTKPKTAVAVRDIKAGEEILMDYNEFNEPEQFKEPYYKK